MDQTSVSGMERLPQHETDVVLRAGSTLQLRPVRPDDRAKVLAFYRGLSPQSLYFRFLGVPRLDEERLATLVEVDYEQQFTLVGELANRIIAMAGYYRSAASPDHAEVAFLIADELQGRGLGTRLLEGIAEIAREHGVTTFEAYVLGENRKMIEVLLDSGFEVRRRLDGGVFHVELGKGDAGVSRACGRAGARSGDRLRTAVF